MIDEVGTAREIFRAHPARTGQSVRASSLAAGPGLNAVRCILCRPAHRAARTTLDRPGAVLGVELPEPVVCQMT